jgi:hypothetical protein
VIISLIILIILLAGSVFIITTPFFSDRSDSNSASEERDGAPTRIQESKREEYEVVLKRIRELDFEQKLGKVPNEDYALMRKEYLEQAAVLLDEIDNPAKA